MMSLAGKIVLLTNASTSFAYSVARHLISCGAKILLTDDDQKRLDYIISGLKQEGLKNENLIGIAANLSVADGRKELFDKISTDFKRIDALILANRPNNIRGNIMGTSEAELNKIYSQFLYQPFLVSQQALPLLEKAENSSILFLSSLAAYIPFIDIGLYSAVQTAVLGLSKSMAQNLSERNIRVNALSLGMFEDDGAGATWSGCSGIPDRTAEEIKQMRDRFSSVIPLGRLGKVDDALGFIEFLVSDQSTYSTGEVYTLTGGISVRI